MGKNIIVCIDGTGNEFGGNNSECNQSYIQFSSAVTRPRLLTIIPDLARWDLEMHLPGSNNGGQEPPGLRSDTD